MRKTYVTAVLALAMSAGLALAAGAAETEPDSGTAAGAETESEFFADAETEVDTSGEIQEATLSISDEGAKDISENLFGIFLEDINHAVDGGLYAELIPNRSFEYGVLAKNKNQFGWKLSALPEDVDKTKVTFEVLDGSADGTSLNENNPSYAVITNQMDVPAGIANPGFLDGLAVSEGEELSVSFCAKGLEGYTGAVYVKVTGMDGEEYASGSIDAITDEWQKYSLTMTSSKTGNKKLRFQIAIDAGSAALDMVSMMPADTWHGLPVRKDLGEALEALNPSFLRFPGGCVIEGRDEASIYSWKDSVANGLMDGDVAARKQGFGIWNSTMSNPYYTTYGLGFYEYFCMAEELDAIPLPVLNAGMTCSIQSGDYLVYDTDSDEFKQCVQDALDLVEFCLGGADTEWGALRIAMGHEEPFALKYIAIGNEQWQTEYHEHYELFVQAFDEAAEENADLYGDIELVVANGPASTDTAGWNYVKAHQEENTTLVDEHYYEQPEWFYENTDRYDSYDRDLTASVFLGEYASKTNTLNSALSEAAFMTGLERNGDVVTLACYAPLFGNYRENQWDPDLIYFSNDSVVPTINYYVQQIFAQTAGVTYLPTYLDSEEGRLDTLYASSVVRDDGSLVIRIVNAADATAELTLDLSDCGIDDFSEATVTTLSGDSLEDKNLQDDPQKVVPEESDAQISDGDAIQVPKYSLTVIELY